jgi:carbonic anhydrase/acetyltransferase-like protein (isoleucine patch superfamily)
LQVAGAGSIRFEGRGRLTCDSFNKITVINPSSVLVDFGAANLTASGTLSVTGASTFGGLIEQRNGTAAQESRIYGTYTGAGDYRRLALKMDTAGVAQIVAEGGGSGALGNRIEIDGLRIGKGGGDIATNTALGASALNANTSGDSNSAVGFHALLNNTTAGSNSAVGRNALVSNTTGNNNSAVGRNALFSNTTGSNNSAVGHTSLFSNTTGGSNCAFGFSAGRFIAGGATANAITNNSVYLGNDTKALANNQTNQIVIGYDATGIGSNTAVLGNDSIVTTALKGNVGIGTTSPTALLDVNSDTVRVRTARTPASAAAAGNAGDICWDTDYIYVCTATDTWKRTAISTW